MPLFWRSMRAAALAALALMVTLTLTAPVSLAQEDDTTVMIHGSLQLEALVRAIRDAYVEAAPNADVQIDRRGQSAGFDALCSGETDLVMATAPIADEVIARCAGHGAGLHRDGAGLSGGRAARAGVGGADACLSQSQVGRCGRWAARPIRPGLISAPRRLTGPLTFAGPQASSPGSEPAARPAARGRAARRSPDL